MAKKSPETILRPDLALLSEEYALERSRQGFVGLSIMPIWKSRTKAGQYKKFKPEQMLRDVEVDRAPGGTFHRSTPEYELDDYVCSQKGHEEPIDDVETAENIGFEDERTAVRVGTDIMLRKHEKNVISRVKEQTDHDVDTPWSDRSNATPKADVKKAKKHVRDRTGITPDLFVCSENTYDNILESTDFRDRTTHVNNVEGVSEAVRRSLVASYLNVSHISVATGIENLSEEGQQFDPGDLWPDDFGFLLSRSQSGSLRDPGQFGRSIIWTQITNNLVVADTYREEQTTSWIYRVMMFSTEKVINPNAGYKLSNLS